MGHVARAGHARRWGQARAASARAGQGPGRVHFVGVGGAGMAPLAMAAQARGWAVSGSDADAGAPRVVALRNAGVETYAGSRPEVAAGADVVVRSTAVPDADAELAAARGAGVPVLARTDWVAQFFAPPLHLVAVAGTHGKTTTAAMAAVALAHAAPGRGVTAVVGGDVADFGPDNGGFFRRDGARDAAVLEADEYGGMFDKLDPAVAVVTSVEWEHVDYYRTPESYRAAFAAFARRAGRVLACADDEGAVSIAADAAADGTDVVLYGHARTPCAARASIDAVGASGGYFVDGARRVSYVDASGSATEVVPRLDVPMPGAPRVTCASEKARGNQTAKRTAKACVSPST